MPQAVPEEPMMGATARSAAIGLVNAYQRFISPLLPRACRFLPTCSEYAALSIGRYGVVRGSGLFLWRLVRCHPFARGGYDPLR